MVDRLDELHPQLILRAFLSLAAALLAVACSNWQSDLEAAAVVTPANSGRPGHVDSILPPDHTLARFVAGLPVVDALSGGGADRDALVEAFLVAVQTKDSAALTRMALSRGEYGYLYYPSSAYSRKPYELAPEIAWMLNQASGGKAIGRVVSRLGGHSGRFSGYDCGSPAAEGENRIWRDCVVSYREEPDQPAVTRQLFGAIIERGGHFKFLSYASDF